MKAIYFIIIFFTGLVSDLYAQEIITDRPDQTESSSTIPLYSFQLETGVIVIWETTDNENATRFGLPTSLLRFGLTKGIELRLANNFSSLLTKGESSYKIGFSDLEIGTKIQLLRKEDINTEVAFLSHLVIPIGDNEFSINSYGTINKFSISHPLNHFSSLGYNIGYNYFGIGNGNLTYSLALGFSLTNKWGFYIEPFGEVINMDMHWASFDGGFTYLLKENIQLDISAGFGLNHSMQYASIGFSWNFLGQRSSN